MRIEEIILRLEDSCENLVTAISIEDWRRVTMLDKERAELISSFEEMKPETLTENIESAVNRILQLDQKIQREMVAAWNQAKTDLLSAQKVAPAIAMYQSDF